MTNLLILSSHSVLEHDDLRLFSRLGYDVFMPGGYADPHVGNDMRPAVPEAPYHPDLGELVNEQRERHAGQSDGWPIIDWGKADLHPRLIDWADIIMVNCFPESWIGMQWPRIRDKRVIWRTIGQSDPSKERLMQAYTSQGCQVVRYSPAEKRAFEPMGVFAGEDAMIRFGKDPADYGPWMPNGTAQLADGTVGPFVGNLAQHGGKPGERDAFINWQWALAATEGLPFKFAGPNSELVGGLGKLPWDDVREFLRKMRVMLYTGTQPASYTLGLMEAMLTGTPVVSIGHHEMWLPELFEGQEITGLGSHDATSAREWLELILTNDGVARSLSEDQQRRGLSLFSYDLVGPQWVDFLGAPSPREPARSGQREAVAA